MRITHVISSLKRGGAETVLVSITTHHNFDDVHQSVIYFHDGPLVESLRRKNITLHHIPYSVVFPFRFFYTFYKTNPDRVHALLWNGMVCGVMAAWLFRVPSIVVFHNNSNQNAWWKNYCDWFVLRFASRFVAVSEEVARSVTSYHRWLSLARIKVLHNGIDPVPLGNRAQLRRQYGLPRQAVVVGIVARFESVKRHFWLIEQMALVMAQHKNLFLLLVGDGSQEAPINDMLQRHHLAERTVIIKHQEARSLYSLIDIFTLTSRQEGIPLALLEAMSGAIPAVVTNQAADHPVLTHAVDGFLVHPDDDASYRSIMHQLIDDSALRTTIGLRGHEVVMQRFSRDAMVKQYKKLLCNGL